MRKSLLAVILVVAGTVSCARTQHPRGAICGRPLPCVQEPYDDKSAAAKECQSPPDYWELFAEKTPWVWNDKSVVPTHHIGEKVPWALANESLLARNGEPPIPDFFQERLPNGSAFGYRTDTSTYEGERSSIIHSIELSTRNNTELGSDVDENRDGFIDHRERRYSDHGVLMTYVLDGFSPDGRFSREWIQCTYERPDGPAPIIRTQRTVSWGSGKPLAATTSSSLVNSCRSASPCGPDVEYDLMDLNHGLMLERNR